MIVVENLTKTFRVAKRRAGVLFFLVCLQVWGIGVRHYRSTGS